MKYIALLFLAFLTLSSARSERIYLSGTEPSDAVEWDFHISEGRQSGEWMKIPVPSNWEQEGFGDYDYGHVLPPNKHAEVGTYRTTFFAPKEWEDDKLVRLVFEASMTETEVLINGKPVGAPNLGGYLPFRYQLTQTEPILNFGAENTLEVIVHKRSSNESLDIAERKADYWVFGGIFRPVYLEVLPKEFINRLAIRAEADGHFTLDVFPQMHGYSGKSKAKADFIDELTMQIETLEGVAVGEPISQSIYGTGSRFQFETKIDNPALWSPEHPNLYQVRVALLSDGNIHHEKVERFGFRTFEVRPRDGFYLNGQKIRFKGVNRNEFHPDTGRAIDAAETWKDLRMIKAMNCNAVRYHMPPSRAYMEACDELGLMVISELTTWQKPFIDTPILRNIVYELVTNYQNHPSVVLWANGNEGGFNREVDELFKLYDLQQREIVHPWAVFGAIDAMHYPNYPLIRNRLKGDKIVLATEFLHGLYAGGHGAGLDDFWQLILDAPTSGGGGFLWCWTDAAVRRTDRDGQLDTAGNFSADGLVGPYREKEASYDTIREIWSPIHIPFEKIPSGFKGELPIQNRFDFTNLSACSLEWQLIEIPAPFNLSATSSVIKTGTTPLPDMEPGEKGVVNLALPSDWEQSDALSLRAFDSNGAEVMQWCWPIQTDRDQGAEVSKSTIRDLKDGSYQIGETTWTFDLDTGHLLSCSVNGEATGLGDGPVLYADSKEAISRSDKAWQSRVTREADTVLITSRNTETDAGFSWQLFPNGRVKLQYAFPEINQPLSYCAVGFELPKESVIAKRWAGDGPYRIWGNRTKGPQYGLWQNNYNETIPGVNWDYPAFKGIFSSVDWMTLKLSSGSLLNLLPVGLADVGILRPDNLESTKQGSRNATWDYPQNGGLFIFHKAPSVGTKFKPAEGLGPQSQPSRVSGPITGSLIFKLDGN